VRDAEHVEQVERALDDRVLLGEVQRRAEQRAPQATLRAVRTLSRTVSSPNRRMFWNVRARPACAIADGFLPLRRWPSRKMSPLSA